jgi:hypothetical protein
VLLQLRLIVPGYVGTRSVKWLKCLSITPSESEAAWQQKDYKMLPQRFTTLGAADWSTMPPIMVGGAPQCWPVVHRQFDKLYTSHLVAFRQNTCKSLVAITYVSSPYKKQYYCLDHPVLISPHSVHQQGGAVWCRSSAVQHTDGWLNLTPLWMLLLTGYAHPISHPAA